MSKSKRVVPVPRGSNDYLADTYGFAPYSDKHTTRLVKAGLFPRPILISPRRQASLVEDLDHYAEQKLGGSEPKSSST